MSILYCNAPEPPVALMVMVALEPPLHNKAVVAEELMTGAEELLIEALVETVHPLASTTTTE
ncbi:MAG: hypothetical protein FNNCIFGK_01582 [Bacteroidia bacterium]|nr:hypothetical protein [Bacteroidia bacterium]